MDPIKTPVSNGIQPIFYQRYWDFLVTIIFSFCRDCFQNERIPEKINDSYITLIPKKDAPSIMNVFRPISLCNTIYKLIAKIISSRILPILNKIISPLQSSFIKGRGIEDNVIIVKEMAYLFHKARKGKNITALKLDITKAYGSLEWSFIRDTLIAFHLQIPWLILLCLASLLILFQCYGMVKFVMIFVLLEELDKEIPYLLLSLFVS